MYGEKHIDHYQHRTSPMDTYKHEFKKSESRLVLGNTIPLSPCSFLVAWLSRDLWSIEPFPFDLSQETLCIGHQCVADVAGWGWAMVSQRFFLGEFTYNWPMDVWPGGLGHKTKEMNCSLLCLRIISFVLFLQALEPSMNFNMSKVV